MAGSEMQKIRVINELRHFIKKLLQDPKILEQSLEIARQAYRERAENGYANEQEMLAKIANEISDTTSVHIPEDPSEHSEADKLYLEVLKEVVAEEQALY
ncbi:hypothetical protein SAMN02745148_01993 [Modicisalibacter ilicicola DSM 19980]|uniref:Uncharacterized protein n=1 Tax=Modicisalibacter ilicicola DSM 19980 TaxID=1121942 RepID=A0A1M4ZG72_9GAMM|nr:hypothetical protein [Halomonas ilicicola]SHF16975.1 hypothetical protein SAMN02745148_01993 [Halomonas ilicicola DSM 19980]